QIMIGIGEVRVVENVKELASSLQAEALSELKVLDHRKVQINKTRAINHVPAHVAEVSGRRRSYRRRALDVAPEFSQLINCGLVSRCHYAPRTATNHMFIVGIESKAVRGEVGDRIGF